VTETELVLASLTPEELDDARRYVGRMEDAWLTQSRTGRQPGFDSDGPFHVIVGLKLAVLRELTVRGGAPEWYAGMPTEGHVAGGILALYQRRYGFREQEARLRPGGLERVCTICGASHPQTLIWFDRPDGMWSDVCRECRRVDREALIAAVELAPPPQVAPAERPAEAIEALL